MDIIDLRKLNNYDVYTNAFGDEILLCKLGLFCLSQNGQLIVMVISLQDLFPAIGL